jgi:hypothetical protein
MSRFVPEMRCKEGVVFISFQLFREPGLIALFHA